MLQLVHLFLPLSVGALHIRRRDGCRSITASIAVVVVEAADGLLEAEWNRLVPAADALASLMRLLGDGDRRPMVCLKGAHGQLHSTVVYKLMVL